MLIALPAVMPSARNPFLAILIGAAVLLAGIIQDRRSRPHRRKRSDA
jgi:hypothetical protein